MPHDNSDLTHHVTVRAKSVIESVSVSPDDAFVLRYTYVKGLNSREVAQLGGMTQGAVLTRLCRLRKRIPGLTEL
jgi:DNA-directed RNA polymerase specialized sigma24 family protein